MDLITSESIVVIVGDICASGLRVLSEGYSNPGSKILTSSIWLIVLDVANILALTPFAEVTLVIPGICL